MSKTAGGRSAGRVKHVPMRKCIGTGERFAKRDLVRLVRTPQGRVVVDETGKKSGSRGAYLSKSLGAAQQALKTKRLEAEFEQSIDPADAEAILEYFGRYG